MALSKIGEKKSGSEIWVRVKKKIVMSTIFLQHFYNKSYVISYYQFKKILLQTNCGNGIAEIGKKNL